MDIPPIFKKNTSHAFMNFIVGYAFASFQNHSNLYMYSGYVSSCASKKTKKHKLVCGGIEP